MALVSTVLSAVSVQHGNGKHFTTLTADQQENVVFYMMSAYVPGIVSLGIGKLAVVALLTRLLMPGRLHCWFLWGMGALCVMILVSTVCLLMLQCTPPKSLWNFALRKSCLPASNLIGLSLLASGDSAFLDFYLAIYPAVAMSKLQMPLKKKLGLSCALGVGLVSGSVGIKKATGVPALANPDVSYELCDPLYWTVIESNTIIIASAIPILQPLMELLKGRDVFNYNSKSSHNHEDYSNQSGRGQDPIELYSKPKKKHDQYGFTVVDPADSQEQFVRSAPEDLMATSSNGSGKLSKSSEQLPEDAVCSAKGNEGRSSSRQTARGYHENHSGGITRTAVVTITYDKGDYGPISSEARWAPV